MIRMACVHPPLKHMTQLKFSIFPLAGLFPIFTQNATQQNNTLFNHYRGWISTFKMYKMLSQYKVCLSGFVKRASLALRTGTRHFYTEVAEITGSYLMQIQLFHLFFLDDLRGHKAKLGDNSTETITNRKRSQH